MLFRSNVAAPRARRVAERSAAGESARSSASGAGANSRFHVVRPGESLWLIAQRYHVKINDLREWNDLMPGDVLKPGVRLLIARPGGAAEVAAESAR